MIGGWEFVSAAYVIAYGALAAYGLHLALWARRLPPLPPKEVDPQ
jgi:hypothetical protein